MKVTLKYESNNYGTVDDTPKHYSTVKAFPNAVNIEFVFDPPQSGQSDSGWIISFQLCLDSREAELLAWSIISQLRNSSTEGREVKWAPPKRMPRIDCDEVVKVGLEISLSPVPTRIVDIHIENKTEYQVGEIIFEVALDFPDAWRRISLRQYDGRKDR